MSKKFPSPPGRRVAASFPVGKVADPPVIGEGEKPKRTSVVIPGGLAGQVRGSDMSHANVVLTAYLEHREDMERCYRTPENRERAQLGLPPVPKGESADALVGSEKEPKVELNINLKPAARLRLAEAASSLGLNRSRYVTGLLVFYFESGTGTGA